MLECIALSVVLLDRAANPRLLWAVIVGCALAGFPTAWVWPVTSRPPGKCSECLYGSSAPTTALGKVVGVWHLTAVGNAESKCTQLKYALHCPMGLGLRACVAHTVLPHSLCPRTGITPAMHCPIGPHRSLTCCARIERECSRRPHSGHIHNARQDARFRVDDGSTDTKRNLAVLCVPCTVRCCCSAVARHRLRVRLQEWLRRPWLLCRVWPAGSALQCSS
jgi:hypothetical protein